MTAETVEIVDVEEVTEVAAPLVSVGQVSIYRSADPEQQLAEGQARARVLVQVVKEQGLAATFGGNPKPHVNVEGWTFLASQFGLIPDIEWTREIGDGKGWEARAQLIRLADGAVLTHAEAECRRDEQNWKNRESYAIRSMAQTRATSKVCRNALSSIMVLAGFAATPTEEMAGVHTEAETPASAEDPHCPPCLAITGELVAVSGPHDRKPFWRCSKKGADCAGAREHNGRTYSWSGWHESWESSRDEWFDNNPEHAGPQTREVGGRRNYSDWIIDEIIGTLVVDEKDAKSLVKPALAFAIAESRFDPSEAFGKPIDGEPSDAQLRKIITNLDNVEAAVVVAAAVELANHEEAAK